MTLEERLRDLARRHGPGVAVDDERLTDEAPEVFRHAAVLVPFVDRPEPSLLLTRRPAHMRDHAGQVAFPGGRVDPGDRDVVATALREAWEEVRLPTDAVKVIGTMAPYRTFHRFHITPVLAVIPPDLPLMPDPSEVARVFEVSCDHVFDPSRLVQKWVEMPQGRRDYWEVHADGERIWGITARMIRAIGETFGLDAEPAMLNRAMTP